MVKLKKIDISNIIDENENPNCMDRMFWPKIESDLSIDETLEDFYWFAYKIPHFATKKSIKQLIQKYGIHRRTKSNINSD